MFFLSLLPVRPSVSHLLHGAGACVAVDAPAHSDLDRKTGLEVFVDMSVSETLFHLIVVGATPPAGGVQSRDGNHLAEASALQKKLRVPDKRFWHIKIKVRVMQPPGIPIPPCPLHTPLPSLGARDVCLPVR